MDNNWIVDNLENAFTTWNDKLGEMWTLLTESPQTFKGGTIWQTIVTINGGMQAIGYGLLVLFLAISIFRSTASFRDFQRPEHIFRHFIYFILAKLGITYGMDLMTNIFSVCNGIVATAANSVGGVAGTSVSLPTEIADAIVDVGFLACDAVGKPYHHGVGFHYDPDGVRALFQTLYVCRAVTHCAVLFCGGKHIILWQSLFEKLYQRVYGRRGHRVGLHHLLCLCLQRDTGL